VARLIINLKFCSANSQSRLAPIYAGVSMKKVPYFLMVVCLAGGLAACGGGSSGGGGEPDNTTEDRDPEGTTIVNTEPLQGLWVISSDVESMTTFNNGELEFEKGEVTKVFQITSTDVQGEIEIKECSGNFWDSGEVISFSEAGNVYDGSTGAFVFTEPRILFSADDDNEEQFGATIVSNTEIIFSPYEVKLSLEDGMENISGAASNTVANKVHDSTELALGRIADNGEDFEILCAEVLKLEVRADSYDGRLVLEATVLTAHGVNYLDENGKTKLLASDSLIFNSDDTTESKRQAYIGPNRDERKYFDGSEVEFTVYDDLTFSGRLVNSEDPGEVTFNGDIQQIDVN